MTDRAGSPASPVDHDRPLSARSIIASTLLGSVPPRLPGRLLVAFTGQFGVQPGTTRTALSRMVDRGELRHLDGGTYELAGDLLARHHRQEAGLQADGARGWDGAWELRVVPAGARSSNDRSALRRAATDLGLWERRDGVWLRPANLDPERLPAARAVVEAQTGGFRATPTDDPTALVAELVDLDGWARSARLLIGELTDRGPALVDGEHLAPGFLLAARALRHLVSDPLLPPSLAPDRWPAGDLRSAYRSYITGYQAGLRAFFRAQLAAAS